MLAKMPIRIEKIAAGMLLSCFIAGGLCALTALSAVDNAAAARTLVNRIHKSDRLLQSTLRNTLNTSFPTEAKRTPLGCDRAFSPIADPACAHIVKRCMA